jgi:Domain of unknown function (DUF4349)
VRRSTGGCRTKPGTPVSIGSAHQFEFQKHVQAEWLRVLQNTERFLVEPKLAALSTIRLRVRPDAVAAPIVRADEWRPGETLRSSARTLLQVLQGLVDLAIVVVVVVFPVLLPLALLVWAWMRVRKRRGTKPPDPALNQEA